MPHALGDLGVSSLPEPPVSATPTWRPLLHLETACSDHLAEALVVGTDERGHLVRRGGKGLAGPGGGELFGELRLRDHCIVQARDNLRRSCRRCEQSLPYRHV